MQENKILDCIFQENITMQLFIPPFCFTDIDNIERRLRNYFKTRTFTQEEFSKKTYALLEYHFKDKAKQVRERKLETNTIIKHCFG